MLRGFYTAASGIRTHEKALNTTANNIANANTSAYKKDHLILGTFGEHLTLRMDRYQNVVGPPIGNEVYMQVVNDKYTIHQQGGFEQTTRPLDMSIMGDGMFVIGTEEGEFLTRDGQFSIDEEGFLVLPGFGRVQGVDGDIDLGGVSDITVDGFGVITAPTIDGEAGEVDELGQLLIAIPEDYAALVKEPSGLYSGASTPAPEDGGDYFVRQFHLERSNVNMAEEMTAMIANQRSLQSCSQIVKMFDQMAETINTRISNVR
jgi:flagellar basal-body rod protein FlgG